MKHYTEEKLQEIESRVLNLTEKGDYGICAPPMKAQVAVNELCRYLLGEDWYTTMPLGIEQCNTEIVYAIEKKYKRIK